MWGIFEREGMPQGACSGREAPTPILDQALSVDDALNRLDVAVRSATEAMEGDTTNDAVQCGSILLVESAYAHLKGLEEAAARFFALGYDPRHGWRTRDHRPE